jgi:hypothetical protein
MQAQTAEPFLSRSSSVNQETFSHFRRPFRRRLAQFETQVIRFKACADRKITVNLFYGRPYP